MSESIAKNQRVYLFASNRMNYYMNKTDFGTFIKTISQLFDKKWKKKLYKH